MENTVTSRRHSQWSALLVEAVNKPGLIMDAYARFIRTASAIKSCDIQCQLRGLEPGPINTFPGWQGARPQRQTRERALLLCMPITRKRRDEESDSSSNDETTAHPFTPRLFISLVVCCLANKRRGIHPARMPGVGRRSAHLPPSTLNKSLHRDGPHCQGYAKNRPAPINPWPSFRTRHFFTRPHTSLRPHRQAEFTTPNNAAQPARSRSGTVRCCAAKRSTSKRRFLSRLYPNC